MRAVAGGLGRKLVYVGRAQALLWDAGVYRLLSLPPYLLWTLAGAATASR